MIRKQTKNYTSSSFSGSTVLSSSASLELLFCEIIREIHGLELSDLDLVKISQGAENNFVGLHCGIMDQFAIGMSKKDHAILLDCATVSYDYAPLDLKDNVILILNTNKRRDLVTSKYNERCEECATGLKIVQQSINGLIEISNVLIFSAIAIISNLSKTATGRIIGILITSFIVAILSNVWLATWPTDSPDTRAVQLRFFATLSAILYIILLMIVIAYDSSQTS